MSKGIITLGKNIGIENTNIKNVITDIYTGKYSENEADMVGRLSTMANLKSELVYLNMLCRQEDSRGTGLDDSLAEFFSTNPLLTDKALMLRRKLLPTTQQQDLSKIHSIVLYYNYKRKKLNKSKLSRILYVMYYDLVTEIDSYYNKMYLVNDKIKIRNIDIEMYMLYTVLNELEKGQKKFTMTMVAPEIDLYTMVGIALKTLRNNLKVSNETEQGKLLEVLEYEGYITNKVDLNIKTANGLPKYNKRYQMEKVIYNIISSMV